jgi:hypothetical protein
MRACVCVGITLLDTMSKRWGFKYIAYRSAEKDTDNQSTTAWLGKHGTHSSHAYSVVLSGTQGVLRGAHSTQGYSSSQGTRGTQLQPHRYSDC